MENLFREILAPTPPMPSTSLPLDTSASTECFKQTPLSSPTAVVNLDWDSEGMQRLLDMLPNVQSSNGVDNGLNSANAVDFPSALDLELGGMGWEMDTCTAGIGVF
jgi:hypothetical protein